MLTLNDGRSELWQWDTGRKLTVDAECSQVHFSNKVFGRSIDVDVVDGIAIIPDILLQTDKELAAWAFVGTPENGYTKISKVFKVNKRSKPADYVFTPPEQTTLEEIKEKIEYLESIQDPDAIKNAVDDYLANNPIMVKETDPTVPEWAKQPTPPDVKIPDKLPNPHSITFTGAVDASYDGSNPVEIKIPDSGGNVELDTTLTEEGKAADAKAVGDAINGLFVSTGESPNVFNGNLIDGYMNTSGRVVVDDTYSHTDYIEVKGTTFIATADFKTNGNRVNIPIRFLTAFDADKNVLADYGLERVGAENTYIDGNPANAVVTTLDSNVKYMVLSIYSATRKYENISVSFDVTAVEYEPYGTSENAWKLKEEFLPDNIKAQNLAKYLSGKTVAVFGDSIMYGAGNNGVGAVDMLAKKYGMTLEKYCVSGATMGVRTDDETYTVDEVHHIAQQVRNAISAGITPDLIILNGGTNDANGGIAISEMTEVYTIPTSESYFADGFEMVAYLLTKNYVGVPIIYMRAHNMSSRTYTAQIAYGELGNKIAEKWGIRNVDMYIRMNTQLAEYQTQYLADYTHPNRVGYEKYYVPALEDFIFSEIVR